MKLRKGGFSQHAALRKYGIQARSCILTSLKKHGILNWYQNSPIPKKTAPNKKNKELEKKLRRLEAEKEI